MPTATNGAAVELREFRFELAPDEMPAWVAERIASGQQAVERFRVVQHRDPVREFHPSNYDLAYRVLRWTADHMEPVPIRLWEWGSGIPMIAALADGLGLAATAIEIDARLHAAAAKWLDSFANRVRLRHGSFVTAGDSDLLQQFPPAGGVRAAAPGPDDGLDSLAGDVGAGDYVGSGDIVYAYPWPGEDGLFVELFQRRASAGAILITFHGSDEFRVRQMR